VSSEDLNRCAGDELRSLDERLVFWVGLAVASAPDAPGAVDRVDWETYDWTGLCAELEPWLAGLADGSSATFDHTVNEDLQLLFTARPRDLAMRGNRRLPSFNLSDPPPLPPLRLADGSTADFARLTLFEVQAFADGATRLAIEQPSHQAAWIALLEAMVSAGAPDTSALNPVELEVHASMLGLIESPGGELGDFDAGGRAVNNRPSRFDGPREHES
jgi:hypothetical protein